DHCFFFQAEDGIRDFHVTGVQTCALPICHRRRRHAHVLADDDGAGARVDDDLGGGLAEVDLEVFQDGDVVHALVGVQRRADAHRGGVDGVGHARAEQVVDAVDDVLGGGEVRAVEVQGQDRKSTRLNSSHVKISY